MSKDWYEEDGAWIDNVDNSCLSCGELHYRESRIPGICVECSEESFNSTSIFDAQEITSENL